jgi:hypothetical protein
MHSSRRSPARAFCQQKHFDTSGKSGAQIHHRAICKAPMALLSNGLLGAIAGKNPYSQLKLHRLARGD